MIEARFEPKGLAPDAVPADDGYATARREDASCGSQRLLDAIFKASGAPVPRQPPRRLTVPVFRPPKPRLRTRRGKPRGSRKQRSLNQKIIRIQTLIAAYTKVPLYDLMGPDKSRWIVRPRQVAVYAARKITGASYQDIALHFGGRDHTTLIFAVKQVEQRIANGDAETIGILFAVSAGIEA